MDAVYKIQLGEETYDVATANKVTFDNSGSGATSGSTFDGSSAVTVSYNTIGAAAGSHTHAASDITSGILDVARGGTGASTLDPIATIAGARNIYAGTDTMTSGTTPLTTGRIYLVYR